METKGNIYCMGIHCPVKNQCLRYTSGIDAKINDGTLDKFERKCTNQKKFLQDESRIVKGG